MPHQPRNHRSPRRDDQDDDGYLPVPPVRDRKRKLRPAAMAPPEGETLDELLARFGIADWDWLIVGDGSGSNYERGCGWASVSVERSTRTRTLWSGAMNRGTVNIAEMLAYMQPLTWISSVEANKREKGGAYQVIRVHIISDSQYCRDMGNMPNRMAAKNAGLWAAFDALGREGFVLNWHHTHRDCVALNSLCDRISKMSRTAYEAYTKRAGEHASLYDPNPDS